MEDTLKATRKLLAVYIEEPFLSQIMQVIKIDLQLEYEKGRLAGASQLAGSIKK